MSHWRRSALRPPCDQHRHCQIVVEGSRPHPSASVADRERNRQFLNSSKWSWKFHEHDLEIRYWRGSRGVIGNWSPWSQGGRQQITDFFRDHQVCGQLTATLRLPYEQSCDHFATMTNWSLQHLHVSQILWCFFQKFGQSVSWSHKGRGVIAK